MLKKAEDVAVPTSKGLNTIYNILSLEKEQTPNCMDVTINYDGSTERRMGTNTQNVLIIAASAGAGFSVNVSNLTNGLQAFWKLDESSGSRADAYGGNTLTDVSNLGNSGGIKNQAANFVSANSNYLFAVNSTPLTTAGNFTISSWVYLNSLGTVCTIASKRDGRSDGNIDPGGVDSGCMAMLHFDGVDQGTSFPDASPSNLTYTASGGVVTVTATQSFGTASGQFHGTDWISTPNSTNFNFAGDFTAEAQVLFSNTAAENIMGNGFATGWSFFFSQGPNQMTFYAANSQRILGNFIPTSNTWYHLAVVRSQATLAMYINGSTIATSSYNTAISSTNQFRIGNDVGTATSHSGGIDELRISNIARWAQPFTSPTLAYVPVNNYEHWLYVNSDNIPTFRVSSSGYAHNGQVVASSFGALSTATWYNVVAWLDSANANIGISVNLSANSGSYTSGIASGSAPFVLGAISNGISGFAQARIDETGYWKVVLNSANRIDLYNGGSGNTIQTAFGTNPWASFDFGASAIRWLTCAAGTGLYASSNLGVTWVNIATDRTANYQYLDRSKNVLVATSDSYDTPLAWSGSSGTFATSLNSNATACRFSINFQGYLILLNSSLRKRGFFYEDENFQLTNPWASNFDIPSSADDEITAAFILRRYLYISTRYKLFRVSFTGGNPVWSFIELKNWGFIPRTVRKIVLTNQQPGVGLYYSIGEIAIGLTWDRKLRVFDGSNDQIISNPVEQDNSQCEFAINKISYQGSGPVISFAETDPNLNVYHLCVAIGPTSSNTTHFLNYDGRGFSFYPWSNMPYNTMCMAESANQRFLMAFDRSGKVHMMNSGNQDANTTLINGFIDTPLIFNKTPSQSTKSHKMDLFFSNTTAGGLIYSDRIDGSNVFNPRRYFIISGSSPKIVHYESIDVPEMYNIYQGRLATNSSTNTASNQPWRLLRSDHFMAGMGIGRNE